MKKNIEDIIFDDSLLEKYKRENENITRLCKKIDKNRKIQKKYNEYLKTKERNLGNFKCVKKSDFNSVENVLYAETSIANKKIKLKINSKSNDYDNDYSTFEKRYC